MTRKQALLRIISVLEGRFEFNELPQDEIEETIEVLKGLLIDIPLTNWTETTIHDSIQQFYEDNKRLPTLSDFKKKCLPPHPVIKLRFGITLREFMNKYYPNNKLCNSKIYGARSADEWLTLFRFEYERIRPSSALEYNKKRSPDTPTWNTIARINNIDTWGDLLNAIGTNKGTRTLKSVKRANTIKSVSSHSELDDIFSKLQGLSSDATSD